MLANLTRRQKRAILLTFDTVMVPLALYAAFCLRFGTLFPLEQLSAAWPLPVILTLLGPAAVMGFRTNWVKLTALDLPGHGRMAGAAAVLAFAAAVLSYLFGLTAPRSVPLIFSAMYFALTVGGRAVALTILTWPKNGFGKRVPVAIYGAGAAGTQLLIALRQAGEKRPVVFLDDNPNLYGMIVSGVRVERPSALDALVERGAVKQVLIAMPSVAKSQTDKLVERIQRAGAEVRVLPAYADLLTGNTASELRAVSPDELLGRDKVDLNIPDVARTYTGRVVMITGAGGSIGSELCRQLLECAPAKLVLYEQSEFALYEIDRELQILAKKVGIPLTTRLGSVMNEPRVRSVMEDEGVHIVLHAAAYKHVPLVEDNELEGARNNVIGTQVVAEAAVAAGVERFILVSTDKAVRPTNIMGATKRMAEMVVQDLQTRSPSTRFAMVRFGNVLGSSGSVLPLFQRQIKAGGPVTVTHSEVTRFFMTIPEAARLVLLAGAYATGGDLFVLDMGEPIKIVDLARRMIELSGRHVGQTEDGRGIDIEITGLRPGEKLYEELLIDDQSLVGTPHSKILRASEGCLSQIQVAGMLKEIRKSINNGDATALRRCVTTYVQGYHRQENRPISGSGT